MVYIPVCILNIMHLEFYIYDNINRLRQIVLDETALNPVTDIKITKDYFWFSTDLEWEDNNTNIHTKYVHFTKNMDKNIFDIMPSINPDKLKYNPKTKCIEYKTSWIPWKKPIFKKLVVYKGELPKKKTKIHGAVFDHYNDRIYFLQFEELADKRQFEKVMKIEERLKFLSNTVT